MARIGKTTANAVAVADTDGAVILVLGVYDRVPAVKFKFSPIST